MRQAAALAVAAAVAVAVGCVAWRPADVAVPPPAAQPAAPAARAVPHTPLADTTPAAAAPQAVAGAALPASLQGTEADGAWRADERGHLVVDRALRRRLDYWLSTVGEWSPEVIGAQVLAAAQRELPPTAAQELQSLWQRYVDLQRHPWQRLVRPADPSSWRPALEERQSVRRLLLGRPAADAFFADEERLLWQQVLSLEAGQPAAMADATPVAEHPQAAERVAEVDAQWARWERRLAEARAELARLRAAPELSDAQRSQALQGWLVERFDAREQLRVRALLGLPAGG